MSNCCVSKDCGECARCCSCFSIPEFNKDVDVPCEHLVPDTDKRCGIYETRFKVCVGFSCLWRIDDTLPDTMRPDRFGFVLWSGVTTKNTMLFRITEEVQGTALRNKLLRRMMVDSCRAGVETLIHFGAFLKTIELVDGQPRVVRTVREPQPTQSLTVGATDNGGNHPTDE